MRHTLRWTLFLLSVLWSSLARGEAPTLCKELVEAAVQKQSKAGHALILTQGSHHLDSYFWLSKDEARGLVLVDAPFAVGGLYRYQGQCIDGTRLRNVFVGILKTHRS